MVGLKFEANNSLVNGLAALSVELREAHLLEALHEAAEPVRQAMASGATRGDEAPHIADNIVVSRVRKLGGFKLGDHEGHAAVAIGPKKGFAYGLPLEYGWIHHPDGKSQPARPFARPAFESTKAQALHTIGRVLWALLSSRGRAR